MAKVTISRLFEVSKYLLTESGKELKDALTYISDFVEVVVRNLRNGLTFADNFDAISKEVTVNPDTETIVLTAERRRIREVVVRQAIDDTYYIVDSFGWKYNPDGNVVIKAGFTEGPPATQNIKLVILIHFG